MLPAMGRTPPGQAREKVLRFVRERLLSGLPPALREVQTAREHLEALIEAGLLTKDVGKARGYRLPTFGLRVEGESMRDAGILSGDVRRFLDRASVSPVSAFRLAPAEASR
jgi:hypothetical protein